MEKTKKTEVLNEKSGVEEKCDVAKKGNRSKFRGKRNFKDNKPNRTDRVGKDNDFKAFYDLNPQLIEIASRVPFGKPAGLPFSMLCTHIGVSSGTATYADHGNDLTFPGICTIPLVPSVPMGGLQTNVIEVASKSIYSWVRHANSGHANYDSPDLMMYLLAMRDVYALCGWMIRIYGLINKYNASNRYLPRVLLEENNIDSNDFIKHQSEFIFYINSFFKRVNTLSVPAAFPLYHKAFWMFSNVYIEDEDGKSQLYQYVPDCFLQFDGTTVSTGSALLPNATLTGNKIRNNGLGIKYDNFTRYADALIQPLLEDEDIGIMSGDIRKAFSPDKLYTLGQLDINTILEPVRDSFVLQQMHNARTINLYYSGAFGYASAGAKYGSVIQFADGTIRQYIPLGINNGTYDVVRTPTFMVDIDAEVPSKEEITEALVMKYTDVGMSTPITADVGTYKSLLGESYSPVQLVQFCTDYVPTTFYISTIKGQTINRVFFDTLEYASSGEGDKVIGEIAPFEWAPSVYKLDGGTNELNHVYGAIHNVTQLHAGVLQDLFSAIWLSLLAVPAVEHIK